MKLRELAAELGLEVQGEGNPEIRQVAPLDRAGEGDITFLANTRFANQVPSTNASAVILTVESADLSPVPVLLAPDPYLAYARVASVLNPPIRPEAGIHPSASVADDAHIADTASIGPHAVVESGACIESDVIVGAQCFVGRDSRIGAATELAPRVTIEHGVVIGRRCRFHPGVVIGADGFGFANDRGRWIKIPQTGGVRIGDDVDVGSNTTIDRGALEDTVIENGVKLDNLIQIAHNVHIGENTAMAGCVGVAGSAVIGRNCTVAGGAGILGHLEICDNTHVTAMSMVTRSIREPGSYSSGTPLQPSPQWRKNCARFKQLDKLSRRVTALEKDQSE